MMLEVASSTQLTPQAAALSREARRPAAADWPAWVARLAEAFDATGPPGSQFRARPS